MDVALRAALGIALIALGCAAKAPESDAGLPSAAPPIAEADFAALHTQTRCNLIQTCCGLAGYPFDVAQCLREDRSPKSQPPYRLTYDAASAGQCIALIRAVGESCARSARQARESERACELVHPGQQPIGAPCTEDFDCAGGVDGMAMCNAPAGTSICQAIELGNAGDACYGAAGPPAVGTGPVFFKCAAGLFCSDQSVCAVQLRPGDPCGPTPGTCGNDLVCVGGVCEAIRPAGAPCTLNAQCASETCVGGACSAGTPITDMACGPPSDAASTVFPWPDSGADM